GTCHFWQIKGDFTDYKGAWKFRALGEATELDLSIDYSFEIPLVGALMKGVLQKLMQQNVDMMSQALKKEAERRV
ncbi:MAG: SRPBCC family protein, partial [Armatimonadetes bacterium]|nr:SRPBCC family protein [Armatimonadota bacterium]